MNQNLNTLQPQNGFAPGVPPSTGGAAGAQGVDGISLARGEMSLVGPRPALPREVALYTQEQRGRLAVTPGVTGLWQVSGRARLSFEESVALDLYYIEHQSLALNLRILLKTLPAVLKGDGAY
jgi:lipopolysaccharide/colanic/teichoic acid biosynthesis glycosyltransferase